MQTLVPNIRIALSDWFYSENSNHQRVIYEHELPELPKMNYQHTNVALLLSILFLATANTLVADEPPTDDTPAISEDEYIKLIERRRTAALAFFKRADADVNDRARKRLKKKYDEASEKLLKHVTSKSHAINSKRYKALKEKASTFYCATVLFGKDYKLISEEVFGKGTNAEKTLRGYRWTDGEKIIELYFLKDKSDDYHGIPWILGVKKNSGLQ